MAEPVQEFDCILIGAGILGTTLAYWLSQSYAGSIAVIDSAADVASHSSSRNSGILHRPFYMDPEQRRVFAYCAHVSYDFWKEFAQKRKLPWYPCGTLEIALRPEERAVLEKFYSWAKQNGMREDELEILSELEISKRYPHIRASAGLLVKTDTSVHFGDFTRALKQDAVGQGAKFLLNTAVTAVEEGPGGLTLRTEKEGVRFKTKFLMNCAGGNAVDIAHALGAGLEYTDLHFRGEYWQISAQKAKWIGLNVHSLPKQLHLPFLGVHWLARANGICEIGPSVVPVSGSQTYDSYFASVKELWDKIWERPLRNKFLLLKNREFLQLVIDQWRTSISKDYLISQVQSYFPGLETQDLIKPGTCGIRSALIDAQGGFPREAVLIPGPKSFHVLNYNSPGASGAPAYAAYLMDRLSNLGYLSHLQKRKSAPVLPWDFKSL